VNIILVLIPLTLILVLVAGWGFFWAVESGQFEDLDAPAWDLLTDDSEPSPETCPLPQSDPAPAKTGEKERAT